MQKLLKGKTNFKKLLSDKQISHKYDFKHSQTLSTNQSKIHHEMEKQTVSSSYNLNIQSQIYKNLNKYGTSNELFYLTDFEQTFGRTRTRQKILMKDVCNQKDEEILQQFYTSSKSIKQLTQLFEYYKYYINNPILFPKQHFKILYNFYQKKKYLQYKRLKAVLDLDDQKNSQSDGSMNENISIDAKKTTKQNTKTFYIMNLIQTDFADKNSQSQSKAFLELNSHLEEMLCNIGHANTPQKNNFIDLFDKNSTLFKKKKITPLQTSSYKNTIVKKTKKQSFHNSNSSLKKIKQIKPSKQPYLSKFNIEAIQFPNMRSKNELNSKKMRRVSNLSMGQLEGKTNNFNISSPKKYHKKRLNSCQTVISKNNSNEKNIAEKNVMQKKHKKHIPIQTKYKEQKTEQIQLQEFKSYLKRIQTNYRKSTQKATQSGISSHSSKFKMSISPQRIESNILIKKLKKKQPTKNTSVKNSLQKSPHHQSKQHLIQESIFNLKKKIRMAKQTIKSSNSSSNLNLHNHHHKKQRTIMSFNK